MKKLATSIFILLSFVSFAQVPTNGLVGYWPFKGNANDASGNNLNGTVYGATLTTDRFGNANAAYNFNGTSNWIDIPSNALLNLPEFTLATWVYSTVSNATNLQEIIIKGPSPYNYGINMNANEQPAGFFNVSGTYSAMITNGGSMALGKWHFIVFENSGTTASLYVDNVLVGTQNSYASDATAGDLSIGSYLGSTYFFAGNLDDIRLYNRGLSATELTALYNETSCTTPVPVVIAPNAICTGNTATLTARGGSNYTWYANSKTITALSIDSVYTTNALSTSTKFFVSNNNGTCESARDSVTVTVETPLVKATILSTSLCVGAPAILAGTGASTYSWSGNISNGVSFIPTSTTTYTVTGTDANGCTNTATVTVHPLPSPIATTNSPVCAGTSLVASVTNSYPSYSWTGPNAFTSNSKSPIVSTKSVVADSGTYFVTVTDVNGCINTASAVAIVNPLPTVIATANPSVVCNGSSTFLKGYGASTYAWSDGEKDSVLFQPNSSATYTVTGTDKNGCVSTSSVLVSVNPLPSIVPICLVSVDDSSKHNLVVWQKPMVNSIDSFIIYREIYTNDFKQIGAVSYHALSQFLDTVAAKYFPFTGDPNAGTYRYKIAVKDTCGNISAMSPYHNTIYVSQNGGTFTWNQYAIEGDSIPIPTLSAYLLYRDNNSTGNWTLINGVAGSQTTITDNQYASYPNASWRVETQWSISCTPTAKLRLGGGALNSSFSNIKSSKNISTGINQANSTSKFICYPNPASKTLNIAYTITPMPSQVAITNLLGQQVFVKVLANSPEVIDISALSPGIYNVSIYNGTDRTVKKLVIE